MLKLGICTIEALRREVARGTGLRVRQVAVTLLADLQDEPDRERLRERVLLELSDDRGAYKRTYSNRFVDFDNLVCDQAKLAFGDKAGIRVIDCGISDGRTAVDLFARLSPLFPELEFLGTDYDPYVRTVTHGGVTGVFSSNNDLVQLIRPPFVLNVKDKDRWITNPINRLLLRRLYRTHVPAMLALLEDPAAGRTMSLYCSAAVDLAQRDSRFRLGRHDVLQPFGRKYHVVRMMNLLNTTYFTTAEIATIIGNVRSALEPGGLFVVGSNQDAATKVDGGIYRCDESGFVEVVNLGLDAKVRSALLAPPPQAGRALTA